MITTMMGDGKQDHEHKDHDDHDNDYYIWNIINRIMSLAEHIFNFQLNLSEAKQLECFRYFMNFNEI